jgi:hypothetical protein
MNSLTATPYVNVMTKWVAQECSQPFSQFLYFHTCNTQRLLHTHSAAHYSVSAIYYIVIGAVQDKKQKTTLTTLVSDLVTTFSCTKIVKYLFIRIVTVVNCEVFCQTATYLLLEGKTCCGLKGMNL